VRVGLPGPRTYGEALRQSLNLGPPEDHVFNLGLGSHPNLLAQPAGADGRQGNEIKAWELHLNRSRSGGTSMASALGANRNSSKGGQGPLSGGATPSSMMNPEHCWGRGGAQCRGAQGMH
jgi:hypothetical protein